MAFIWDKSKRVYRDDDGRIVPESRVKGWLDDLLAVLAALFITRAAEYYTGKIEFTTLFAQTESEIESLHYAAAAIAFGGFSQMSQQDSSLVEVFIVDQLSWFRMLMLQIYNQTVSEQRADARLAMYALAGFGTYENARAQRERNAGMLIYKRILKAGNNCEDCIEFALRGWRLIGQLPGIGQNCACRSNCRCHFIFSDDLSKLS